MTCDPWIYDLALCLCQAAWQSTFLLLFAHGVSRWPRQPADRAAIVDASLVLILVGPLVTALLPHYVLRPAPEPEFFPLVEPSSFQLVSQGTGWTGLALTAVVLVWVSVAGLHLFRLCRGIWLLQRTLRGSTPYNSSRMQSLLARVDDALQLEIRIVPGLSAPSCWQFRRSFLLLPDFVPRLSEDDLELILRHEIAHLRSAHPVRLLLNRLVIALYWFHPLVYRLSKQSTRYRELACDDWAARTTRSRRHYANVLIDIAERTVVTRDASLALAFQGKTSDLPARVSRLMKPRHEFHPSGHRRSKARLSLAGVCLLMIMLSVGRITGDITTRDENHWTPWPTITAEMLDLIGIEVIDYDPYRFRHEPRERRPEHREAHHRSVRRKVPQHPGESLHEGLHLNRQA